MKSKQSNKLAKYIKLKLNIYPYTIYCFMFDINNDKSVKQHNKQYKKVLKLNQEHITEDNIQEYKQYKGHCVSDNDSGQSVIHIYNVDFNNLKNLISILSTIRHEVHHACNEVFEFISAKTDDNEPLLYLNDYVFKQITKMIWKQSNN